MTSLRFSILRAHAASAWALLITVVAATTLFAAAFNVLLGAATTTPDSISMAAAVTGWTLAVTVFSILFLVAQSMAFALEARRREFALLRLAGATPRQVSWQIMTEATMFGFIGSFIGFLLGWPTGALLRSWLVSVGFADPALDPTPEPWSVAVVLGIGMLTCCLGAAATARRSGRVEPIEALGVEQGTSRVMTASRWIFSVLALGGAIAILAARTTPEESLGLFHIANFLLIGGLAALTPVIVPPVARSIGIPLVLASPGSGFLAVAHISHAVRRSAALAVPLLILAGISTSFLFLFAMKAPIAAIEQEQQVGDIVATGTEASVEEALESIAKLPELGPTVVIQATVWWTQVDDDLEDINVASFGGDPIGAGAMHVMDGSWADVGTDVVAITNDSASLWGNPEVGDVITVIPEDCPSQEFRVGAVVNVSSTLGHPSVVFTPEQFAGTGLIHADSVHAIVNSGTAIEDASAALKSALPNSQVEKVGEMASRIVVEERVSSENAAYSILAAGVLLSLLTIVTTQVSSIRERSREFALLRRLGASSRQIAAAVFIETGLIVTVVAVAVVINVAFFATRTSAILHEMGYSFAAPIPAAQIGVLFAAGVVAALGAATTTLISLRRQR